MYICIIGKTLITQYLLIYQRRKLHIIFYDIYWFLWETTSQEGWVSMWLWSLTPVIFLTTRGRRVIDRQKLRMVLWGMFYHSFNHVLPSSCRFWSWRLLTRLPSSFHKCSIRFKSGNIMDQSKKLMLFVRRSQSRVRATFLLKKLIALPMLLH